MEQTEQIAIGRIIAAVGLRGEVKVYPYSDRPERFAAGAELLIDGRPARIEAVRFVKKLPVLKLDGVANREEAESMRGRALSVNAFSLPTLPDGEWYVRDLIGCGVYDEAGTVLGAIADVIQNGAQDLYEIARPDGRAFLLPAVGAFVLHVDVLAKRVIARVPEGLSELAI